LTKLRKKLSKYRTKKLNYPLFYFDPLLWS